MTPAALAAVCGFAFSPPAAYDALPLPTGAVVIEIPISQLGASCREVFLSRGQTRFGCALPSHRVAYVPTWKTWPGTLECYNENRRHEEAHLKGWIHP